MECQSAEVADSGQEGLPPSAEWPPGVTARAPFAGVAIGDGSSARASPGDVLIDSRPVHAEGTCKQDFLERDPEEANSGQCAKVPYATYIAGREPPEPCDEGPVIG